MTSTLTEKTHAAQSCLADLRARGIEHLVEGVHATRLPGLPIIRLRKPPGDVSGVMVRRYRSSKTMAAEYLGCQLRWEESRR